MLILLKNKITILRSGNILEEVIGEKMAYTHIVQSIKQNKK